MNFLQLLLGLVAGTLFSSAPPAKTLVADPEILDCATAELHEARLLADPKYAAETARMEGEWTKAAGKAGGKSAAPPYVLPIVFHVVHENGAENIPDADILRSVDYLNQALANTDYYDPATGVATDIQVCLARRTPDNLPTNGITRTVSPLTDLNSDDDRDLKDLSRWEPRDYVNVWVVKEICGLGLGCGVAGYAYYPSAHGGSVDGIVMEARWLAGDEARVGVLIHELGHYLGLRHTFDGGCGNDDCTRDGDRVCDTPPDQSTVAVPCTGSANSCATDTDSGPFTTDQDDMHINYMDYGYFRCYSAFTAGQRERMHFFLEGRRRSLLESFGCKDPCPALVTAGFTGGEVTVEVGTTVNFTNTSLNGSGFTWQENGTVFSTATDPSRTFISEGTFQIQLVARSNDSALCAADSVRQTVRVTCSVSASFSLPGIAPRAEQPVTFTNTSTNGGQRRWLINGVLVSTGQDLNHTFPNPGLFEVCLAEGNGFCEREFCYSLIVFPPPCQGPGCGGDTTSVGGCGTSLQLNYTSVGEEVFGNFNQVVPTGDGYVLGGTINNQAVVLRVANDGTILWQRQLVSENRATIDKLIIDQDGFIAGIGEAPTRQRARYFVFRIAPDDGTVQWTKIVASEISSVVLTELIQPAPGENYRCFGSGVGTPNVPNIATGGIYFEINPGDGTVVNGPPKTYDRAGGGTFGPAVHHAASGNYFVLGSTNGTSAGGTLASSWLIAALSANGNVLWVRQIFKNSDAIDLGGLNLKGIQLDGDTIVLEGWSFGRSGTEAFKEIIQLDLTGDPLGNFELYNTTTNSPESTGYIANKLLVNDAGYLINDSDFNSLDFSFREHLTQLDREGNVLWAKAYPGFFVTTNHQGLALDGTTILLPVNSGRAEGVFSVLRISPTGEASACIPQDTATAFTRSGRIRSTPVQLSTNEFFLFTTDLDWGQGNLLQYALSCPEDCTEEICDNELDDDGDGYVDCDDPDLATNCCCLPSPSLTLGQDTSFCPGDILREGTDRNFAEYAWSTGARTDSIVISEAGTYWLMVTDSCGNVASDTITLHPRARPLLELGPDTTLCANAIVPFLAQDGFASYEWTDGTTEKDFTAFGQGTYWVVATDSCGGVQTDSVRVTVDPATVIDLGRDTLICPGDTLIFRVDGFSDYQWSQSSFIDCFDCPEVRFAPTSDTLLLLAAQRGPGCFSSDSIRVRVAAVAGSRDSVYLCPGDRIVFGESDIFNRGQYYDVQQFNGCDFTDTLDVFALRDTLTSEVLTICPGDSVLVFGAYVRASLLDRREFPTSNGCDSIHQIEVIVLDTSRTAGTINVCAGDSALVFGVFEREPGVYAQTFTNAAGCDSTHAVTLETSEILVSTRQIRPDCGGANAGWGEVRFESDGVFEVRWSDGSFFKRNERLFAGIIYTVTVTDGNGCSVVDSLVVDATVPPELQSYVIDESCPGANDGEIGLLDGSEDLLFSLEGGPYLADSVFQNLPDGEYRITIQDGDGCTSRVDLEVGGGASYTLELPDDLFINLGDSVLLTPETDFPLAELSWETDGTITCNGCPELSLRPTQTTLVTAIAGDNDGCAITADVRIIVNRDDLFYVPNAFSPNGDNLNEGFRVYPGPAVTRILSLEVFDRWGGRVFRREDFDPEAALGQWDGRLANGRDPGIGVYVYQVQVELFTGEVVRRAGEVLVMR